MKSKKVLFIEVDVNDGDYESFETEITTENQAKIDTFIGVLKILPQQDKYYYQDGKKVVVGKHIRFENNVGECSLDNYCGLKSLLVDKEEWDDGSWTIEEVRQEGMITEDEYNNLSEFLPMYCDYGFHTIVTVDTREVYEPVILTEIL